MSIEDTVKRWESEIKLGVEYKDKFSDANKWSDYYKYYRGDYDEKLVAVNKIFAYVRSLVPRVYFRKPMVSVSPTKPGYSVRAKVVEAIDNYLIRELALKKPLKSVVLEAALTGTGILKLGFDSEFGYLPGQAIGASGETVTQTSASTAEERIEYSSFVRPGMPWAMSVAPSDIITPYGIRDVDTLPWIAHAVFRPLEDVKQDTKYRNTKDLKGGFERTQATQLHRDLVARHGPDMAKDQNLALLWEIRDLKRKEILTISEGQLLLQSEDALQIEGFPYEFLVFNEDPEHFWGISDLRQIVKQQMEINATRTVLNKHVRLSTLKFLYSKGSLRREELDKLLSDDVLPGVEVEADNPQGVIFPLAPHVPQDLYMALRQSDQDISDVLGFSSAQSGNFSVGTPPTAHEVQAVQAGASLRSDERRDMMADMLTNVLRKWNQYIFKFWSAERAIKIAGPSGGSTWVKFTGEELAGEYDIQIEAESGLPITRDVRAKQAISLFQMLRNDPLVDQNLLRKIVVSQFEWTDPSWGMILPQQDAMMQANALQGMGLSPGASGPYVPSGGAGAMTLRTPGGGPENPMNMEDFMAGESVSPIVERG